MSEKGWGSKEEMVGQKDHFFFGKSISTFWAQEKNHNGNRFEGSFSLKVPTDSINVCKRPVPVSLLEVFGLLAMRFEYIQYLHFFLEEMPEGSFEAGRVS